MADGGQPGEYFAKKRGLDFLAGAKQAERNWLYTAQDRGIWRLWWLIYCQVLGIDSNTGESNANQSLRVVGEQAGYTAFRVQLTRRLIQQRVMMAQDQRPSFRGVATSSDAASEAGVNIATKAIDYLLTEAKLEQKASEALTANGYFGEGGLHQSWDYQAGKNVPAQEPEINPDTKEPFQTPVMNDNGEPLPQLDEQGQPVLHPETGEPQMQMQPVMKTVQKKSGAPKIDKLYAWQIVKDPYMEDDHPWMIVKLPVNKYELAAKYAPNNPALYSEIVRNSIESDLGDDALFAWGSSARVSSDTVVLRIFYHRNCEALPGGRWTGWVGNTLLWGGEGDVPCPLDDGIPVKTMIADRYFMTAFGYAESGDLLSVQTAINELFSQALTSVQKYGNPNMYKSDQLQIDQRAFSEGGHMFDLPNGVDIPQVVAFEPVPAITPQMWESLIELMEKIAGSNSVVGGDPKANITSGAFAVLLVNIAQKFASAMQQAYDFALTATANDSLELVRKNAVNGFWAEIGGLANEPYEQLIKSEDLQHLRRIKIERQNPVMSTFPGRMEIFNATKDLPPNQRAAAMEMLLTNDTEAWAENDQSARIRIRKENERMLKGIRCEVGISDPHLIEGPMHIVLLNKLKTQDPDPNPQKEQMRQATIQLLEQHLVEHGLALASLPPPMAAVCGTMSMLPQPADNPNADPNAHASKPGAAGGQSPGAPKPPQPPQPPEAPPGAPAQQTRAA
jgi:hypothetical protein